MKSKNKLGDFCLQDRKYNYLARKPGAATPNNPGGATNDEKQNAEKYTEILRLLEILEFEPDQIEIVQKILAAIILLGEIIFVDSADGGSEISNPTVVNTGEMHK